MQTSTLPKKSIVTTAALAITLFACAPGALAQDTPPRPDAFAPDVEQITTPDVAAPDPAPPMQPAARPASRARYFVEFRSRSALSYGHTFVVFGRTGEKLKARNVAGLHPKGDSSITYMVGHLLPVPSETGFSDGDLEEQYLTARYRLWLSAADYRVLVARVRDLQASSPVWNAATYNCNAFVGVIAHFIGLNSPPTWLLPEDYVNGLRALNGGRQHATIRLAESADRAMARRIPSKR